MRHRSSLIIFAAILCGVTPILAEPIDLTPLKAVANGDGPDQDLTVFRQGQNYVAMRVPANWSVKGSTGSVAFNNLSSPQTSALLRPYAGKIDLADEKKATGAINQLAVASPPPGSLDVILSMESQAISSFRDNKFVEANISFNLNGNALGRSVILFQLPTGELYSFVITGQATDFNKVRDEAMIILFSMFPITGRHAGDLKLLR